MCIIRWSGWIRWGWRGIRRKEGVAKSADDVIKQVKASNPNFCKVDKCVDFASEAQTALEKEGISGIRVRVSNGGAVGFDGNSISKNGVHEFIDVDGKIYDNLTSGLTKKDYMNRFEVSNPDVKLNAKKF